jgi:hypothetical protein
MHTVTNMNISVSSPEVGGVQDVQKEHEDIDTQMAMMMMRT